MNNGSGSIPFNRLENLSKEETGLLNSLAPLPKEVIYMVFETRVEVSIHWFSVCS